MPEVDDAMRPSQSFFKSCVARVLAGLDRNLGRGAYPVLRDWIDPSREYCQLTYARLVSDILQPRMRWLDAGCGHQIFKAPLETQEQELTGRVALAVGCDLDLQSLHAHRALHHRVCSDLVHLPIATETIDVVTMNMVAEHFEDPPPVFAEVRRVLKPGGRLLVHTPNAWNYGVWVCRLGWKVVPDAVVFRLIRYMEHRLPEDVYPTYYRANTSKRLRAMANSNGLVTEQIIFLPGRPLLYFVPPIAVLELLTTRVLASLGAAALTASSLLAIFRRKETPREPVPS